MTSKSRRGQLTVLDKPCEVDAANDTFVSALSEALSSGESWFGNASAELSEWKPAQSAREQRDVFG